MIHFCFVAENCKEAWRNIRIAFIRSLKPKSGGAAKKKYYLHDALQFIFPYLNVRKENENLPGNLPSPEGVENNEEVVDDPPPRSDADPNVPQNSNDANQKTKNQNTDANPDTAGRVVTLKKRKPIDPVDECIMEYLHSKKAAPAPAVDSRKLFLLSLQGDVNEMTAAQFRTFKRKVGLLVEEILNGDDLHSVPSYTSSYSVGSCPQTPVPSPMSHYISEPSQHFGPSST